MSTKLNPLLDELKVLVDRLQDISIKANAQYEAAQDPTRLQFIDPMNTYKAEQTACYNQAERQAMFEYRKIELMEILEEAGLRYNKLLLGF